MSFPKNGRVAIIDDKVEQALPIMNALAQRRRPYVFYTGEVQYLPEEDTAPNDIRVLFLDINLIDNSTHEDKVLKGRLIPVLNKVIPKNKLSVCFSILESSPRT